MLDLARRCINAVRAMNWGSGAYDLTHFAEYVNPNPPLGDPFEDPEEVARALALTRQSILAQARDEP